MITNYQQLIQTVEQIMRRDNTWIIPLYDSDLVEEKILRLSMSDVHLGNGVYFSFLRGLKEQQCILNQSGGVDILLPSGEIVVFDMESGMMPGTDGLQALSLLQLCTSLPSDYIVEVSGECVSSYEDLRELCAIRRAHPHIVFKDLILRKEIEIPERTNPYPRGLSSVVYRPQ